MGMMGMGEKKTRKNIYMKKKEKRYSCIYVTTKKPNFPERFWADNRKNRNIPEGNSSKQMIKNKKKKKKGREKTIFNG